MRATRCRRESGPVGVKHGRQLDELAADESGQEQNQCGQRERDRAEETEVLAVRDEQRGDARTESKGQAQIVKISEGNIAEDPGHLRESPLAQVGGVLSVVGRDPAHAPTRQVEEDAGGRAPEPQLLRPVGRGVEVREMKDGRHQIGGERQHHQCAVGDEMLSAHPHSEQHHQDRAAQGEDGREIRNQRRSTPLGFGCAHDRRLF